MHRSLCLMTLVAAACVSFATARAQEAPVEFSADVKALPFPPDAQKVEFDTTFKDVEFVSRSPLTALADFYRREMIARGWEEDEDEASIDDDEIELTFKHGSAEVVVELERDDDGEVDVKLDCEGLTWDDAHDPVLLAEAGVPQPRSHLFLQREFPRPEDATDVKYDDNACKFKCPMEFEKAARHFQATLVKLGWRQESGKPFLGKFIHRYAYRRGPVTLTVSANKNHQGPGSWITVEYASTEKEPALASLSPVGRLAGRPATTDSPDSPGSPDAEPAPDAKPVNVAANKGSATVTLGKQKLILKNVAAYQSDEYGTVRTTIVFCDKAIPFGRMQKMLAEEDGFSIGDLFDSGFPSYLSLQLTEDDVYFSFSGAGAGISNDAEGAESDVKELEGRVVGTIKMTQPLDFFDKPFLFQVTFDAGIMRRDTRLASGSVAAGSVPADSALNDAHGLPVPHGADEVESSKSKYRQEVNAKVSLPLAEVVAIYRREMPARKWTEDASASSVAAEAATLAFKNAAGPLTIGLTAEGSGTKVKLVARDAEAARRDGMLPEPGKARLIMGNAHSREIVISIGKSDYRLAAGRGAKDPKTALKYTVPPGKYRLTIKIPGEAPQTETVEAEADTAWGVVGLPTGGYFIDQLY